MRAAGMDLDFLVLSLFLEPATEAPERQSRKGRKELCSFQGPCRVHPTHLVSVVLLLQASCCFSGLGMAGASSAPPPCCRSLVRSVLLIQLCRRPPIHVHWFMVAPGVCSVCPRAHGSALHGIAPALCRPWPHTPLCDCWWLSASRVFTGARPSLTCWRACPLMGSLSRRCQYLRRSCCFPPSREGFPV